MDESQPKEVKVNRSGYLLERKKKEKFLYNNFHSMRTIGITPYKKTKPIRPELGDYEHVIFALLFINAFLYLSQMSVYKFYRLGKIVGYCSAAGCLKVLKIKDLTDTIAKTGLLFNVFQNKQIQSAFSKGWETNGGSILELVEVNKKEKKLKYTLRENSCKIVKTIADRYHCECSHKPYNFFEMGILCGQMEILFGGTWDSMETKCVGVGDPFCELELYLHEGEISPKVTPLPKEEYEKMGDALIKHIIERRNKTTEEIGGLTPISISQSVNYLLLSTSKGQAVASKWVGKVVGVKMIKEAKIRTLFDALECLKDIFLDLRTGILEYELRPEAITVKLRESVYSSGVENIGMKLCIFLAGIVEGGITEATKKEWIVTETQCTANGDPLCEFECKSIDPDVLTKLLLG